MRRLEVFGLAAVAVAFVLVVAPAITGFAVFGQTDAEKCLDAVGASLFCAEKDPRCGEQLDNIGDVADYVNYVECGAPVKAKHKSPRCTAAKIEKYPTWSIHSHRIDRLLTLEQFGKLTACNLTEFTPN